MGKRTALDIPFEEACRRADVGPSTSPLPGYKLDRGGGTGPPLSPKPRRCRPGVASPTHTDSITPTGITTTGELSAAAASLGRPCAYVSWLGWCSWRHGRLGRVLYFRRRPTPALSAPTEGPSLSSSVTREPPLPTPLPSWPWRSTVFTSGTSGRPSHHLVSLTSAGATTPLALGRRRHPGRFRRFAPHLRVGKLGWVEVLICCLPPLALMPLARAGGRPGDAPPGDHGALVW